MIKQSCCEIWLNFVGSCLIYVVTLIKIRNEVKYFFVYDMAFLYECLLWLGWFDDPGLTSVSIEYEFHVITYYFLFCVQVYGV